jgi:hypothetical protein
MQNIIQAFNLLAAPSRPQQNRAVAKICGFRFFFTASGMLPIFTEFPVRSRNKILRNAKKAKIYM